MYCYCTQLQAVCCCSRQSHIRWFRGDTGPLLHSTRSGDPSQLELPIRTANWDCQGCRRLECTQQHTRDVCTHLQHMSCIAASHRSSTRLPMIPMIPLCHRFRPWEEAPELQIYLRAGINGRAIGARVTRRAACAQERCGLVDALRAGGHPCGHAF